MKKRLLFGTAALFAAAPAEASGDKSYIAVAATRTVDESKADTAEGLDEVLIVNATAAWVMPPGFSLGLKYFNFDRNEVTTTGYGPLIGFYHQSGFFVNAAYLYKPVKKFDKQNDDGYLEFKEGDGTVVDLGKVFEFGAWGAGVQVTYHKVNYKKATQRDATVKLTGSWWDSGTYPYLVGVFYF